MPSYEQPSSRSRPGEDDHYAPSKNAKPDDIAEEVEETQEDEPATPVEQDERKAITWSDLAEEKSEDALAPLLETGPRAPCLISPDGSKPESSVKRFTASSADLPVNLRGRSKEGPKKASAKADGPQPGEIEPGSFVENLSGVAANGYPEDKQPKREKRREEPEAEQSDKPVPTKEAFVPKEEASEADTGPRNTSDDEDADRTPSGNADSEDRPQRKRRRRRSGQKNAEGEGKDDRSSNREGNSRGERNRGDGNRGEGNRRQPRNKQGDNQDRQRKPQGERQRREQPAKAKAEPEPKGLFGKVKKVFGSLFGSEPAAKEEPKPEQRSPKKKSARKGGNGNRSRDGGNRGGGNRNREGGNREGGNREGGGQNRRRRPRKRARRQGGGSNGNNNSPKQD